MARASSVFLNLKLADSNGDLVDITKFVDDAPERSENISEEEVTPFGTDTREYDTAGIRGFEQMTFSGYLTDDQTHPLALLEDALGSFRDMQIEWINGDLEDYECLIISTNKIPQQRNLTRYSFTVRPQHVNGES
jgi:hypothetical protein